MKLFLVEEDYPGGCGYDEYSAVVFRVESEADAILRAHGVDWMDWPDYPGLFGKQVKVTELTGEGPSGEVISSFHAG